MLTFVRNKVIGVERIDRDTLAAHGILDDDIYSLQINVTVKIPDLEITAIDGHWNRWTTPECPRATGFLSGAVGFRIEEESFSQKVHKIIGRKACRHYANLLLECCHSVKEAALIAAWEDKKAEKDSLSFSDFLKGKSEGTSPSEPAAEESSKKETRVEVVDPGRPAKDREVAGRMVIDLHLHTSEASPCSSAPLDRLITEARSIGLDGICLTDHNHVWEATQVEDLRQKHGFLILRGNEITTNQGDMLVFGLERDVQGIIPLEDLREEVLEVGGFMIVAHPFRGFLTFGIGQLGLTPEKAMQRPLFKSVDAIEVMNGKVTPKENEFAQEVAALLGMAGTGGSDAHEVAEVGVYATRFSENIQDEKGLIEALKAGKFTPVAYRREIRSKEE